MRVRADELLGHADVKMVKDLARAPNRRTYAGLVGLQVHLRARRNTLFEEFLELWRDYERKGSAARLAFALSERSQSIKP